MKSLYRHKRSGDRNRLQKANTMAKQLYVENLGTETNEALPKALFLMFGAVEKAYVIPDPQTGKWCVFGKPEKFEIYSGQPELWSLSR